MSERLGYDAPKLTRDEATEFCVYHLRCAAGLFELVPDDNNAALLAEIDRQAGDDILKIEVPANKAWAAMMLRAYDKMKDND